MLEGKILDVILIREGIWGDFFLHLQLLFCIPRIQSGTICNLRIIIYDGPSFDLRLEAAEVPSPLLSFVIIMPSFIFELVSVSSSSPRTHEQ
jgi:hypothetical protein